MARIRTRDGHSLFVRVLGRGSPCLLVHGFASDSRSFFPFVAPLLHRHRFVIPDLRGFGQSHHVPLELDCPLTEFAQDLEDVLDALAIERSAVAGISMGAFATLQAFRLFGQRRFSRYLHIDQGLTILNREGEEHGLLGAAQPAFFARVRALLSALEPHLASPFHELPSRERSEFWSLMGEFAAHGFSSQAVQHILGSLARRERAMERLLPVARWQVYLRVVRAYLERGYDLREAFAAIEVPVTVLIGGRSRMYPPAGQHASAALLPHARVREVSHAGHMLPFEAPLRFVRELREFLAEA